MSKVVLQKEKQQIECGWESGKILDRMRKALEFWNIEYHSADLEKLAAERPDMLNVIEEIVDPATSPEERRETINRFNEENMKEREGMYVTLYLPIYPPML